MSKALWVINHWSIDHTEGTTKTSLILTPDHNNSAKAKGKAKGGMTNN